MSWRDTDLSRRAVERGGYLGPLPYQDPEELRTDLEHLTRAALTCAVCRQGFRTGFELQAHRALHESEAA